MIKLSESVRWIRFYLNERDYKIDAATGKETAYGSSGEAKYTVSDAEIVEAIKRAAWQQLRENRQIFKETEDSQDPTPDAGEVINKITAASAEDVMPFDWPWVPLIETDAAKILEIKDEQGTQSDQLRMIGDGIFASGPDPESNPAMTNGR